MLIDCDTCPARDLACGDCVVGLLLGAPQNGLDLDADEATASGALAAGAQAGGALAKPPRMVAVRSSTSPDVGRRPLRPGARSTPAPAPASTGPVADPPCGSSADVSGP